MADIAYTFLGDIQCAIRRGAGPGLILVEEYITIVIVETPRFR
jgi:hypothetical protein